MLGNGKKLYTIGKHEDIAEFVKMEGDPRDGHPDFADTMFFMDPADYDIQHNRRWLRRVAQEIREGTAMLRIVSSNDDPERVFAQEVRWLKQYDMVSCSVQGWVPRGQEKPPGWEYPRLRIGL